MKKKKILFIAIANSSHTVSWIDLLTDSSEFDTYLFGVNGSYSDDLEIYLRKADSIAVKIKSAAELIANRLQFKNDKKRKFDYLLIKYYQWIEKRRLKRVIRKVKPDIIHTLGFEPSGYLLMELIDSGRVIKSFKWIHTSRGSELSLKGYLPPDLNLQVLEGCDHFIADNKLHYSLAEKIGLDKKKLNDYKIIPGTGGIDLSAIEKMNLKTWSERDRIIIWPKAYECSFSKALPVFEAFKIAWNDLKPCKIIMTAATAETMMWFQSLPNEIIESSIILERIDRTQYLKYLSDSKVLLAPSLSDGIPNSIYEAMAYGVVPIVSPLCTFKDHFQDKKNVHYARNLYPEEIAAALIDALNHKEQSEQIVKTNRNYVKEIADRKAIKKSILKLYNAI